MANTTADKLAKLEATKSALKSAINGSGSTVGDKFADYPPAITNGRAGIAAAITEKGVQTPADAPFDVLEANVRKIESGAKTILAKFNNASEMSYPTVYYATPDSSEKLTIRPGEYKEVEIVASSILVMEGYFYLGMLPPGVTNLGVPAYNFVYYVGPSYNSEVFEFM